MPRRSLQRSQGRGSGQESRQGPSHHSPALSPWSDWRENVRHHIFVTDVASGATRDLTPGDFDSPPFFYEDGGLAFSPDGSQLAFVSNREGNDVESWTTNQDVWLVPAGGGQAKRLTTSKAADVQPAWNRGRQADRHAIAAAAQLRIRSLVSRGVRCRDRPASSGLRIARSLRRGLRRRVGRPLDRLLRAGPRRREHLRRRSPDRHASRRHARRRDRRPQGRA